MAKKKSNVIQMPVPVDPESLLCGALHDMCDRIEGAQRIVMLLAKFDPKGELIFPFEQLQNLARLYVVNNMESTVGVRKMAREKWGMMKK